MSGLYFFGLNLESASLLDADLSGADLTGALLNDAYLARSDLRGSILVSADLNRAHLNDADFRRADLSSAALVNASLQRADLSQADLSGTDLGGADLSYAILKGTFYELAEDAQPKLDSIARAMHLETLRYDQPRALTALRNAFKEAGYREQERKVTYAIKHGEINKRNAGWIG